MRTERPPYDVRLRTTDYGRATTTSDIKFATLAAVGVIEWPGCRDRSWGHVPESGLPNSLDLNNDKGSIRTLDTVGVIRPVADARRPKRGRVDRSGRGHDQPDEGTRSTLALVVACRHTGNRYLARNESVGNRRAPPRSGTARARNPGGRTGYDVRSNLSPAQTHPRPRPSALGPRSSGDRASVS